MMLFPFAEYWWFYASFIVFVLTVLALDLGVFHRKAHVVEFREALTWSIIWVALAVAFGFAFGEYAQYRFANDARLLAIPGFDPNAEAQRAMLQFFTGYIVEKALSVDNIFVFVVVFFVLIQAFVSVKVVFVSSERPLVDVAVAGIGHLL